MGRTLQSILKWASKSSYQTSACLLDQPKTLNYCMYCLRAISSAPPQVSIRRRPELAKKIIYATFGLLPFAGAAGYYAKTVGLKKFKVSSYGLLRFARSVKAGLAISIDYWWTMHVKLRNVDQESPQYIDVFKRCHQRAADRMFETTLKNGGLYVKLGQGLCTMTQLLPQEYTDTLKPLEDKALDFFQNDIFELFQEEFGCSPDAMFAEFNPAPVAAASLALVFKATTKEGKQVAVKAQYIDLQDRFDGDIWCVEILLKIVEWMHPTFGFTWILQELKGTLAEELDFINEAKNSERCKKDFEKFEFITVPDIHWDKTTKRIMTADWYDGCKIDDLQGILDLDLQPEDAAKKLIMAFGEQIFSTGFIHGDPHSGNVLVTRNLEDPSKVQLIVLDHGLYENISKKDQLSLCNLWTSIIWKQDIAMKQHSVALGIREEDYMLFCEMLIMRPIRMEKDFNLSAAMTSKEYKYVQDMAAQRFDEIMGCLRRMPKPMILVFRNLNIVRSINHRLGSPADRFTLLANCAINGSRQARCQLGMDQTWRQWIGMILERIQFDYKLRIEKLKLWFLISYLKLKRFVTANEELCGIIRDLKAL